MARRAKAKTARQLEEDFSSLKYGEARERLDTLLESLESNEVDIDDLSERVKEAAALIRVLHGKLTHTQGEVEKVMDQVRESGLEDIEEGEDEE